MRFLMTFAVALVLLSALAFTAPAQAATVTDCQTQIEALRTQTEQTMFTGRSATKDQAGLLDKLDTASMKLVAGKNTE